jgi:hypothetical protein
VKDIVVSHHSPIPAYVVRDRALVHQIVVSQGYHRCSVRLRIRGCEADGDSDVRAVDGTIGRDE